jgi:hypothetical protein
VSTHFLAKGVDPTHTVAAYLLVSSTNNSQTSWEKNLVKRSASVQEDVMEDDVGPGVLL